jgi:hypothetical protein
VEDGHVDARIAPEIIEAAFLDANPDSEEAVAWDDGAGGALVVEEGTVGGIARTWSEPELVLD